MINFRYHLVSIVAVFLALAIGIVLGSTELQGAAIDVLRSTSNSLSNELASVRTQRAALEQQVTVDQQFAQAAEPRLLGGLLTGQRVVLIAAPGAPGQVITGVSSALRAAGATVTGQLSLQPKLLDASATNQQYLSALVGTLTSGSGVVNGTGLQQAAQLLGSAILTKNASPGTGGGQSSGQPPDIATVLTSYARAGLLSVSGHLANPATLAVVVSPAALPSSGSPDPATQSLVTFTEELSTTGLGTVMAGSATGSGAGSAIATLRGSNAAAKISTVDDADTAVGQIVAVQALTQALTGHKTGAYGGGPGSNSAGPSPAPTPTATTSVSSSAGSSPAGQRAATSARRSTVKK